MYDVRLIANEFIRRGMENGYPLTPLHVQKLVFFAHARMLVMHNEGLVEPEFRAWQHGPVFPDLYDELQPYGAAPVAQHIPVAEVVPIKDYGAIDWTYRTYGHVHPLVLSELTHHPDGPWAQAKKKSRASRPAISDELIRKCYYDVWMANHRADMERINRDPRIVNDVLNAVAQIANNEYHTAPTPEDMLEQIDSRRDNAAGR